MLKYIAEINAPWVMEVISEQFDDVLNRLPSTAIVYGGAIRDVLARKPLKGDLDIAVPDSHYSDLVREFDRAVKWRTGKVDSATIEALTNIPIKESKKAEVDGGFLGASEDLLDRVSSTKQMHSASYGGSLPRQPRQPRPLKTNAIPTTNSSFGTKSLNYKFGSSLPLSHITTFVTFNNKEIQIISSKSTGNELEDSIYIARHVDIICCGVIMTTDGKIYEVVKGAYEDCIQNILRFNDFEDNIVNINRLKERIVKLTERGWKSEINIKKLTTVINKRKALVKKKEKAALLKQLKQAGLASPKSFRIEKEQYDACGGIGPAKIIFFNILTKNNIFSQDFKITETSKGYTFTDKKNRGIDTLIQIKRVFEQALLNKKDNKTVHLKTLIFELRNIEINLSNTTELNIRDIAGNLLGSTFIVLEAIHSNSTVKSKHNLLAQIHKAVHAIPNISLHNLQKCIIDVNNADSDIRTICNFIGESELNHYFPVKKPSVTRAIIPKLRANKNDNFDEVIYGGQTRTTNAEPLIEETPVVMNTVFSEENISIPVTGRVSSTKINKTNIRKVGADISSVIAPPKREEYNEDDVCKMSEVYKKAIKKKKVTKTSKTNLW